MESVDYYVLSYCLSTILIISIWFIRKKLKEEYGYEYRVIEQIYIDNEHKPIVEYIIEKRFLIGWTYVVCTSNIDSAIRWRDQYNNDVDFGRHGIARRKETLTRKLIK